MRVAPRLFGNREAFGVLAACATLSQAAPAASQHHVHIKTDLDPTVLHSRVKLTNEYTDREFGISRNKTKLNLSHAFGNAARRDWTVQLDFPLVAYRAGDFAGAPDATGIGDIEMRIGHVVDAEGFFRWAVGIETQFNTAAQPQLGDGVFRISPLLAFALEPSRVFKFQTNIQFDQSMVTETGVNEQQDFKVKPAVTFKLPEKFYAHVETELKWNTQAGGEFGSKLKFEVGRGFGHRGEWVVSARYEMPLTESHDQHVFTAGCAYVFP